MVTCLLVTIFFKMCCICPFHDPPSYPFTEELSVNKELWRLRVSWVLYISIQRCVAAEGAQAAPMGTTEGKFSNFQEWNEHMQHISKKNSYERLVIIFSPYVPAQVHCPVHWEAQSLGLLICAHLCSLANLDW